MNDPEATTIDTTQINEDQTKEGTPKKGSSNRRDVTPHVKKSQNNQE